MPQDYAPPQLNSSARYKEMQRLAGGAGGPAPMVPQPAQAQQPGILQGLMSALQGYFRPAPAAQAGPPMQQSPDPNEVLNRMRATTQQASQIR